MDGILFDAFSLNKRYLVLSQGPQGRPGAAGQSGARGPVVSSSSLSFFASTELVFMKSLSFTGCYW